MLRDEDDYAAHVDHIHYNPVKHWHVDRVRDWPHSSIHRYVRKEELAPDWGGTQRPVSDGAGFGEL